MWSTNYNPKQTVIQEKYSKQQSWEDLKVMNQTFLPQRTSEDMYDFECHWRSGGRNNKGTRITHDGNLTDGRGQQCRKGCGNQAFCK